MDLAEYQRLRQFEQRFERRLAGDTLPRYQQDRRRRRIRAILYAFWYAGLAFSTASTIYHLAL